MNPLEPLSSLASRGRAEALARQLDGKEPPHVAQLLRETGHQLAAIGPSERFRAELRTRLLAVAAVQAAAPAAPVASSRAAVSWRATSRASGVAAGALASVVAVTGVAVAGSQSLPGDPFYGVKRATEALQLRTADGDLDRGTRHLEFAATRLGEVRRLTLGRDSTAAFAMSSTVVLVGSRRLADGAALGAPVAQRVRETLSDMDADTLQGQALLSSASRSARDDAPLRALSRFATRQSAGLEQLLSSLPVASRERALSSLALVTEVGQKTDVLLGPAPCGPACDPASAAPSAPLVSPPSADPLEPGLLQPSPTTAPCGCATSPAPAPGSDPGSPGTRDPASTQPEPSGPAASGQPSPEPTGGSAPSPAPSPSPSPSGGPLPVPLPVPLPSTPIPLPTPPVPLPSLPSPIVTVPGLTSPSATALSGVSDASSSVLRLLLPPSLTAGS